MNPGPSSTPSSTPGQGTSLDTMLNSPSSVNEKLAYLESEVGRQELMREIEEGSFIEDLSTIWQVIEKANWNAGMIALGTAVMSWFGGAKQAASSRVDSAQETLQHSWEAIRRIANPGERVRQAALYAIETNMDCFTADGNHCSGWVDSVFNKAGLQLYNPNNRLYVAPDHEWGAKGTLDNLALKPGDSVIYENGNQFTGKHNGIVTEGARVDSAGNYRVKLASQNVAQGTSGIRSIGVVTIPARDIKVVTRPA